MLTPADDRFASGIVSFEHRSPEELGRALNEKGIILWAGDGRLRASVHIYNSEDDIDRLLIALKELNGTARPI
jgi:selenocysteine lyase/cysteine desulfurase